STRWRLLCSRSSARAGLRPKLDGPERVRRPLARCTVSAIALLAAVGSGCGAASRRSEPLSAWLSFNAAARTVTLRLIAAYNGVSGGFNFNGYGKVQVLVELARQC